MRSVIIAVLACLVLSAPAMARNVEVTLPKEEGSSSMEFRAKALDEAFVEAVLQESRTLLPATLSQSREALFREALERKAGYYVLGYDSVKVTPSEEGISLTANVNVNRTALREGLKSMGLFATATKPIPVSFAVGELSAEDTSQLAGLMELTGVESASSGVAKFGLDKNEKGIFEAHLKAPGAMWQARGKDLPVVWDQVWSKYFERKLAAQPKTGAATLRIAGWFTPDGAREFDRVLRKWDGAVSDVRLVELDMLASGVSGMWEIRIRNRALLTGRLDAFLPDRGLSYTLSADDE
ncbi:hypothetical protein [Salidesulfovibrio brasiliensis]